MEVVEGLLFSKLLEVEQLRPYLEDYAFGDDSPDFALDIHRGAVFEVVISQVNFFSI